MLLSLPFDVQHLLIWRYCALPDGVHLDFETVRSLRLTCHALYALLDNARRWYCIVRSHFPTMGTITSVLSFTDYMRYPFTIPYMDVGRRAQRWHTRKESEEEAHQRRVVLVRLSYE